MKKATACSPGETQPSAYTVAAASLGKVCSGLISQCAEAALSEMAAATDRAASALCEIDSIRDSPEGCSATLKTHHRPGFTVIWDSTDNAFDVWTMILQDPE